MLGYHFLTVTDAQMVEAYIPGKGNVDLESYSLSDHSDLPESADLLQLMIDEIDHGIYHLGNSETDH